MARLRTYAKKKLNKALVRVEKVVIMEVRKMIDQQKKWKAKIMNNRLNAISNNAAAALAAEKVS